MSLAGKWIVVTGGHGDIGKAIYDDLNEQEACVERPDRGDMDVTDGASVRRYFDGFPRDGYQVQGLVVCHGAPGCIKPSLDLTDEEFQKVIDVDLVGTFRVCREAARLMLPQGKGHIVVVSSIHALATYPERAAYAAAKAGVCGLVRALAVEWAQSGLYVNAVLPGQVWRTQRTANLKTDGIVQASHRSPSGTLIPLKAVASAVSFLLASSGINGHSLVVDDAWTASAWFKPHDQR